MAIENLEDMIDTIYASNLLDGDDRDYGPYSQYITRDFVSYIVHHMDQAGAPKGTLREIWLLSSAWLDGYLTGVHLDDIPENRRVVPPVA
jgi:hypothetical protein